MSIRRYVAFVGIAAGCCFALTVNLAAQGRGARTGAPGPARAASAATPAVVVADDPFSGPVVTNAPFSADAITTVTQVLSDGTRIEENTTAKFYRDSAGRVRREQSILGLAALNPSGEPRMTITVDPDPNDSTAFTLDPTSKTARRVARSAGPAGAMYFTSASLAGDGPQVLTYAVNGSLETRRVRSATGELRLNGEVLQVTGTRQPDEALGTRQMEGVTVTGRRTKSIIPIGQIGNDRPIEITDERWESAELRLLIRSHHHDPRTGDVEYRLTNITRVDPPADLFMVPPDYTEPPGGNLIIVGQPGLRIGGATAAPRAGAAPAGTLRSGGPAGN